SPDLHAALGGRTGRDTLARQFADLPPELSGLDRFLQRDLATSLVDDALVKVDRASMAASLEVRSPLLDHRVVERAFKIPASVKLRGRESKAMLKNACADLLPEEVRYGSKRGFEVPFGAWFARREWRDWLISVLEPGALARQGLFDPATVVRLRDQLLKDPEARGLPISAYQLRHRVWMLALFQVWSNDVLGIGR
ncbi:MAG: asparagine synthase C-terminal domain-containing protein, partial [Acidobacteriota bacterium]